MHHNMAGMTTDVRAPDRLPRDYLAWLAAAFISRTGDAAMYFALGWAGSAYGGTAAGLIITAIVVPRTVLLLLGGAIGDRFGSRAIMIAGDATLMFSTTILFFTVVLVGSPIWLLITAAFLEGIVTAFYLPASGSMPRRLVNDAVLPRALALRGVGSELADLAGGPLGGLLVGLAGFAAAAGVNAVSFAAVLIVLIVVRPTREVAQVQRRPVLIEAGEGVRLAMSHAVIRTSLLLTGMLAGLVIPVGSVLLPLLIRGRGWSPVVAGATLGAQSLGSIAVALVISRRGAHRRPGLVAILGLFLTVLALELLAFASTAGVAVSSGVLLGAGISLFTSHTAPLILGQAPITHLARVQAVLSVIQSAMLVLTTPLLGLGSSQFGAPAAITACGALLAVGGIAAALSRPFRCTRTQSPQPELA